MTGRAIFVRRLGGVRTPGLSAIPRMIRAAGGKVLPPHRGVLAVWADAFTRPGAVEGFVAAKTPALLAAGESRFRGFVGEHSSL